MGKSKYNAKARSKSNFQIDNDVTQKISIDIKYRIDQFDDCNALVIPSKKRKTHKKDEPDTRQRLLSKKKRKLLEKIIDKKAKKKMRTQLVEELGTVTISEEERKQYISLTAMQTKGLRKYSRQVDSKASKVPNLQNWKDSKNVQPVVNAIKGARKFRLGAYSNETRNQSEDPNILGFENNSDDENSVDTIFSSNSDDCNSINKDIKPDDSKKMDGDCIKNKPNDESSSNNLFSMQSNLDEKVRNISKEKVSLKKDKVEEIIIREPASFIHVDRKPEIQEARLKLPILGEEQRIVEAIKENSVVIITGETGSGKTTQVPQFLYESGFAKNKIIGITEPRRVAAYSMSKRVAEEMNCSNEKVSYLIRFEGNVTPDTKIKFMTDGVLLKEIQTDFLLSLYTVIILDEAHERSVYTDILIGLLTRIVALRNKRGDQLKLIIMSATMRVDDFVNNSRLFKVRPPIINVESRQFPVTIHFNKKTDPDYVRESIRKTIKIHTKLPEGGILIFLTGQREVNTVVKKLRKAFPHRKKKFERACNLNCNKKIETHKPEVNQDEDSLDEDFFYVKSQNKLKTKSVNLPKVNLDAYSIVPPDDVYDDIGDTTNLQDHHESNSDNDEDDVDDEPINLSSAANFQPLYVLPLYSMLSSERQAKVFEPVPPGCRLCVVSTNVAETSLTIPNIKYVVDSGKCKIRVYDKVTGVTRFLVDFTSKAAANQRAGRCGRTSAGHCYRLYSSAVFNDQFQDYSLPEICRKPVDDLILQMKIMHIDKVVNFPFPTPPGEEQLRMAEKRLCMLGALENPTILQKSKSLYCTKVTDLGKTIATFPVLPRYGKMLALSQQNELIPYTICLVSALSVQELLIDSFSTESQVQKKLMQIRRFWAGTGNSFLLGDAMILISAVGAGEYAASNGKLSKFCTDNGLREKAMIEIRKLRQQLTNEILLNVPTLELTIDPAMSPPSDSQARLLRQIILSGMIDHVAHKLSSDDIRSIDDKKLYKYAYKTMEMEEPVFMHTTCILKKDLPEWVVYQEIYETNKIYMRGITVIEPAWLPIFAPSLCNLGEPLEEPAPRYDSQTGRILCHRTGTFGPAGWELPIVEMPYPNNLEGIKWFIKFLVEGEIFPKLKRFVSALLSSPKTVTKSWAKLLPRIESITTQLLSKGIITKRALIEEWQNDPNFLLSHYKMWLPESAHAELTLLWPPL